MTTFSIEEMFNEKNKEIFYNKIGLDIDNNSDSEKQSTTRLIQTEMLRAKTELKRIYDSNDIVIDEDKLLQLLMNEQDHLIDFIDIKIEDKANQRKQFLQDDKAEKINKQYVKKFHNIVDSTSHKFNNSIELFAKKTISVELVSNILKFQKSKSENMHDDITSFFTKYLSNKIITRTIAESKLRSNTLKNFSLATYEKYTTLPRHKPNNIEINSSKEVDVITPKEIEITSSKNIVKTKKAA